MLLFCISENGCLLTATVSFLLEVIFYHLSPLLFHFLHFILLRRRFLLLRLWSTATSFCTRNSKVTTGLLRWSTFTTLHQNVASAVRWRCIMWQWWSLTISQRIKWDAKMHVKWVRCYFFCCSGGLAGWNQGEWDEPIMRRAMCIDCCGILMPKHLLGASFCVSDTAIHYGQRRIHQES